MKLAAAASVVAEEAWDVNQRAGSVMLKNGASEFIFGQLIYLLFVSY